MGVKSAGDQEIIEIRPEDLDADYVIWFCFGGYYK